MEEIIVQYVVKTLEENQIKLFDNHFVIIASDFIREISNVFNICDQEVVNIIRDIEFRNLTSVSLIVHYDIETKNVDILNNDYLIDYDDLIVLVNKIKRDYVTIQDYANAAKLRDIEKNLQTKIAERNGRIHY